MTAKIRSVRRQEKRVKARVDLNLLHLDPWTALKSISIHAHHALINGKRKDDWLTLSVILGKCNAIESYRRRIVAPRGKKGSK